GVLMSAVEGDPIGLEYVTAFAQALAELGWSVGRNVRIEYRWGAGDLDRFRRYAAELVALSPDVVLASAGSIVGALQQASRTVPIVFVTTIDPVGGGWVESAARAPRAATPPRRRRAAGASGDRIPQYPISGAVALPGGVPSRSQRRRLRRRA